MLFEVCKHGKRRDENCAFCPGSFAPAGLISSPRAAGPCDWDGYTIVNEPQYEPFPYSVYNHGRPIAEFATKAQAEYAIRTGDWTHPTRITFVGPK